MVVYINHSESWVVYGVVFPTWNANCHDDGQVASSSYCIQPGLGAPKVSLSPTLKTEARDRDHQNLLRLLAQHPLVVGVPNPQLSSVYIPTLELHINIYIYTYIYIILYTYICACMYIYLSLTLLLYIYMYVCICMYVCMYVCMYLPTPVLNLCLQDLQIDVLIILVLPPTTDVSTL